MSPHSLVTVLLREVHRLTNNRRSPPNYKYPLRDSGVDGEDNVPRTHNLRIKPGCEWETEYFVQQTHWLSQNLLRSEYLSLCDVRYSSVAGCSKVNLVDVGFLKRKKFDGYIATLNQRITENLLVRFFLGLALEYNPSPGRVNPFLQISPAHGQY